jgi:uncharacterized membrane protein YraQ (UPF0718 family)
VAIGTALLVERQYRRHGNALLAPLALPPAEPTREDKEAENGESKPRAPFLRRIGNVSETALHDFVDITVFLILGALLAAGVRMQWTNDDIASLSSQSPVLAIGVMMLMAMVLCLCSEADAFVAASFVTLPSAAKLAFLVLGPMMDIKLYILYTRVFRPRLIWTIIPAVVVQVFIACVLVHYVWTYFLSDFAVGSGP